MDVLELVVAGLIPVAILLPHLLPLHRVDPAVAATVWMCVLMLRALTAIGAVIFVFVFMPRTGAYDAIMHWCWHEALPVLATHLGLSGHPLAHAAIVLPGMALAGSLLWALFGLAQAWLLLRVKLRRTLGGGPLGSTVIADHEIVIGVSGIGRTRILVSDRALGAMDRDELAASLNHELGHIRRRHRPLRLLASVLVGLGRPLPGTRSAETELRFSLERDADEYAVRRTRDPLSLASAICKTAAAQSSAGTIGLGGSGRVMLRLDYLEGHAVRGGRRLEQGIRMLAVTLVGAVVALSATLPSWALTTPRPAHTINATGAHCAKDVRAASPAPAPSSRAT